jgi:Transposase DDE domain
MPQRLGGNPWRPRAPRAPGWGQPRWCCSTSRRCISRITPQTDSASLGSKERRLEPQITLGLLTDASGFPLTVEAFEGNKAETATMLPVINAFKGAHNLTDVTVVADAGMISEANQVALQAARLSFILGTRIPYLPDVVREWRDKHPDEAIPEGLVLTQPWPATSSEKARGIPEHAARYR